MTELLCPRCETDVDEHAANLCLNLWLADVVMDGRLENYCATIAAAWEVVETVNEDNAMMLRWYNPDGRTSHYSVAFGFGKKVGAEADSAPLAICRAALKAVNAS